MKKNPKISIVIPSYNKAKYIGKTLESIFTQDYGNYEVIVQDGSSTDGSIEVINKYAKKYKNIKWESKKDKGQLDAINKGFSKATGDLLTFINADDIYCSNAFKSVSKAYKNNPKALWFAGKGNIINEKGEVIHGKVTTYKNIIQKINRYFFLLAVNYLTQPSVFINKEAYRQLGPFTGTENYVMEYEMWLRFGKIEMPTLINEDISSFRLFMGNISTTSYRELLELDYKIAQKHTNNKVILLFHRLNNLGRVKLAEEEKL